jgi:UDP-2-acetamido-2,6-beta-L-arabino-hexul-4-ose reductase
VKVLVTGAAGFIGRHICEALNRQEGIEVLSYDEALNPGDIGPFAAEAEAVIHLAGINRPPTEEDFDKGNRGFTQTLCEALASSGKKAKVIFSSSAQAVLDNPYGRSKKQAEESLETYSEQTGAPVAVFRLTNVFGKWARPNYNSAVATFSHNIAKGLPIEVHDPQRMLKLVYIDDVVSAFLEALHEPFEGCVIRHAGPEHEITLQGVVDAFMSFKESRTSLVLPDFSDPLIKKLYATYISWLTGEERTYQLDIKSDPRGSLAEFIKAPAIGQVFVSRTKPGITRGNHYHHTKPEKFLVLEGEATVRFRHIETGELQEHKVTGEDYRVIDITPGWTHSIENTGTTTLITLFWAGELFDPNKPDTIFTDVLPKAQS